ncbi:MAG: thiamine diphosphokinase [Acidimicrobiia bacterium]|nr:thiamine diphosphokinase [Acidimicrobiia bacterium]
MEAIPDQIERALVVTGGDPWSGPLPQFGAAIARVVAADSGVELALQLGLPINTVIGDLDSAPAEALREAERLGATLDRHAPDKDETDLELALDLVCGEGARDVVVVGGVGGRLSHLIGIATLLANEKYADVRIVWLLPQATVHIANPSRAVSVDGAIGDLLSLIPVGGGAVGVTTSGLKWSLHEDDLPTTSTRGISNRMLAERVDVSLQSGTLLVIHEENQK